MTFAELPVGTPFRYDDAYAISGQYIKVSARYAQQKGRKSPVMIRRDANVVPVAMTKHTQTKR